MKLSHTDKVIGGVCGGLGEHFELDPTILRIIFVICAICGVGAPVLLYIVAWILMSD